MGVRHTTTPKNTTIHEKKRCEMDFEIFAEDLGFPEGPVVLDDGSVIVVEISADRVTRCWGDGRKEVIAVTQGGPNGAAIGADGAIYICNIGGCNWETGFHAEGPGTGGRIERIDMATGKIERLYTECDGQLLGSPNDLVIDKTGGIWFTDIGRSYANCWTQSGLFYCTPDGSSIRKIFAKPVNGWGFGANSYNGVGLSPDQQTIYVADMRVARVIAFALQAPGQLAPGAGPQGAPDTLIATIPGNIGLDSLAITESGKICVGTLMDGGITIVDPSDGTFHHIPFPDHHVTNIAFGGDDMRTAYITLSGSGKIIKTRWPEPGMKLNF
jgi:gluconolactonase